MPSETPLFPQAGQLQHRKATIMGDRSPKSVQKQASQKQTKASSQQKQKDQAAAAKLAGAAKRK
jgi:hypothetical protein